ncbi:MAG: hypothetical protein ABIZ80_04710, partial [Bryobacteraceae bacterium]
IYVASFPAGTGKWKVSSGGGQMPRWRRDGKELYYFTLDRKLMAVPLRRAKDTTLEAGTPAELFRTRIRFYPAAMNAFLDAPAADEALLHRQ